MFLTLNRPESLNAFSEEMVSLLKAGLHEADASSEIKVIVLKGAGRSFGAGGDIKSMAMATPDHVYEHLGHFNECILAIKAIEKPVIAVVHGFAAGAAFNLALACDFILASETSQFALSFSQVGLISDGGGTYFLPKLLGPHLAKQFLFSAEPIPAQRLYDAGVISSLVPQEQLEETATAYAMKLAHGPTLAYGKMKKLIDASYHTSLEDALEQERLTQKMMAMTSDHKEGITAFAEKRKPAFVGK
ncbi:enoyl-CoA hydratase/isomerase family protein [Fictibacillus macauensis]|nr:enoyl-CoA hydratase-related protein [Fictibacillus macauensis]